ncbi:MAG: hypothetical protein DRI57_08395 [Deltaproteobacteria bacterium]|nr:MAG: hypothetical protein DRI57_08395 [Deltaproteobacteria bacterium]
MEHIIFHYFFHVKKEEVEKNLFLQIFLRHNVNKAVSELKVEKEKQKVLPAFSFCSILAISFLYP